MDPEFLDSSRVDLEDDLLALGAIPLSSACTISEERVEDPRKAASEDQYFKYVEISDVDPRDGFVLITPIRSLDAPSRARLRLHLNEVVISSVRPARNAVGLVSEDLDGSVGSTGFVVLRVSDIRAEVLFCWLKTGFAVAQLAPRARASMYPTLAPADVLDILVPPIDAHLAKSCVELIKGALQSRIAFLGSAQEAQVIADDYFRGMDPNRLEERLSSRSATSLSRSHLFSLTRHRMDPEYFAPAFEEALSRMRAAGKVEPLGRLIQSIATGRTPASTEYLDNDAGEALVVKVGALTNLGINWAAIEFAGKEYLGHADSEVLEGDILLTASAHSQEHIAKKVDVVLNCPGDFKGRLTCAGELLKLRVNDPERLPPHYLAAFLRNPLGRRQIQRCIRGITSHVYPEDIQNILIPLPDRKLRTKIAKLAKESSQHRWSYREKVREAVGLLEEAISLKVPLPSVSS